MMTITNDIASELFSQNAASIFMKEDSVIFDIETTGFSAKTTQLYLIGAFYLVDGAPKLTQWFADSPEAEAVVISTFFTFLQQFKTVIHYNGSGFDIPYLLAKCTRYNLPYSFESYISHDIFKETKGLHKLFHLENFKQKTVERFLGIERTDTCSGGELINVYQQYLKTKDQELLQLLLLHNADDVRGLFAILPMLSYTTLLHQQYEVTNLEINSLNTDYDLHKSEAVFTLHLESPIPKRVSIGNDLFYMTCYENTMKISAKIYSGELKYFYSNYKDYYYLPNEDQSIHKSVAFYVDKNFRTKAKAANCYSKKTGMFLAQYEEIVSPYFKIDYYDKILYFELEDDFRSDKALQKLYAAHILKMLLTV